MVAERAGSRRLRAALLLRRMYGEIDALFVVEQARHHGVARGLMRAAEAWVGKSGVGCVELGV